MTTFLFIYVIIQSVALLYWLCEMLTTIPTFKHEKNRFLSNWEEGGNILFVICILGSLTVSYAFTKGYLWLNFLENHL